MKPIPAVENPDTQRPVLLNAIQHKINIAMADICSLIGDVQVEAVKALESDRTKLERKIDLINRVADKTVGLVKAVPVPVPDLASEALDAAAKKLKEKIIGDMRGEMTSAMDAGLASMNAAKADILWELNAKRSIVADETTFLLKEREEVLSNGELSEVERYEKLRKIEKCFSVLEAYAENVNSQMDGLKRSLKAAKQKAVVIAAQGPETGHQESVKRMPEQHGMTQAMYQRAVLKYMETRFTNIRSAPILKSEEIKMLEQAFPTRFVMKRTPLGEKSKKSHEFAREKTKIRVAERDKITKSIDPVTIRKIEDNVEKEKSSGMFGKRRSASDIQKLKGEAVEKHIDSLMAQQCSEHVIEQQVRAAMVPNPLNPTEKVCPTTADRYTKMGDGIDPDAAVSGSTVTVPADGIVKISSFRAGNHTKDCIHAILEQEREKLKIEKPYEHHSKDTEYVRVSAKIETRSVVRQEAADLDIAKAQMFKAKLTEIKAMPMSTDEEKAVRIVSIQGFEEAFKKRFSTPETEVTAAAELGHFKSFRDLQTEKTAYLVHVAEVEVETEELAVLKREVENKVEVLQAGLAARGEIVQFNEAVTEAMVSELRKLGRELDELSGAHEAQKSTLERISARADNCNELLEIMFKTDSLSFNAEDLPKFPEIVRNILTSNTDEMSLDEKVAHDHFAAAVIAQYRIEPYVMKADLERLATSEAQVEALKVYEVMHEVDRTTPASVGNDIDKFHRAVGEEIARIQEKVSSPKPGSNTQRKLKLLQEQKTKLEMLKGQIDTKVSFLSIQRRLGRVVDKVMEAAKIQRRFIHGQTTSSAKRLSKFESLKERLAERREAARAESRGTGMRADTDHDASAAEERRPYKAQ